MSQRSLDQRGETLVKTLSHLAQFTRRKQDLILIAPLLLLSWYATTVGALTLLGGGGETDLGLAIFVGVFVAIMTIAMKYMLDQVLFSGWVKKLIALPGYAALVVFSVAFGFAWWWERLQSGAETVATGEAQLTIVRTFLREASNDLQNVDGGLAQLAARSERMAGLERSQGRTCEANVGAGDGPRRVFRDAEAVSFANQRDRIGTSIATLNAQIDAVEVQLNDWSTQTSNSISDDAREDRARRTAALNSSLNEVEIAYNGLLTASSPIARLAADYPGQAELYRSGGERSGPNANGETRSFRCTDVEMADDLDNMVSVINALPTLDIPEIQSFDNSSEATRAAFQRLRHTVVAAPGGFAGLRQTLSQAQENAERNTIARNPADGEGGSEADSGDDRSAILNLLGETGEPEGLRDADWLPLAIAGLVDLSILVMTLLAPRPQAGAFEQEARDREAARNHEITYQILLKNAIDLEDDAVYKHLQKYLVEINGDPYIVVPKTGPNSKRLTRDDRAIANFVNILRGRRLVTVAAGPGGEGATTGLVNRLLEMKGSPAGGREGFHLYRMGRRTLEQLIREFIVKRDEQNRRDSGGYDPEGPERPES